MKILDSNSKNFKKNLDILLQKRKNKIRFNSLSVSSIIRDVKKNGDKAVLKYEKRFNKNTIIAPSYKKISETISTLDKKVKRAIDLAYNSCLLYTSPSPRDPE